MAVVFLLFILCLQRFIIFGNYLGNDVLSFRSPCPFDSLWLIPKLGYNFWFPTQIYSLSGYNVVFGRVSETQILQIGEVLVSFSDDLKTW